MSLLIFSGGNRKQIKNVWKYWSVLRWKRLCKANKETYKENCLKVLLKRDGFHWNWDPVRFVRFQKTWKQHTEQPNCSRLWLKLLTSEACVQSLFRLLMFVKERKASPTCRFLSMHQLVSKSSSSSPKGLISCSATCNGEHRMSPPWCLWRLRAEFVEDSCFTLWFLLSPFTAGSLEQSGSGLVNTQVFISQQDWTLRPPIVHLGGSALQRLCLFSWWSCRSHPGEAMGCLGTKRLILGYKSASKYQRSSDNMLGTSRGAEPVLWKNLQKPRWWEKM